MVFSGVRLDGLTFKYSGTGRVIHVGGKGGKKTHLNFGKACLLGLRGRAGAAIDSIGFITAELSNA